MLNIISSSKIKPVIGMKIVAVGRIDSNVNVIGNTGTIMKIEQRTIKISWNNYFTGCYNEEGIDYMWNANISNDWDKGHLSISFKNWKEYYKNLNIKK